ncbi:hypothetical protein BKA93DRAFT_744576, partial [Sparassis latifolia]
EELMKNWWSLIYAFFELTPAIEYVDGRCVHTFKCSAKHHSKRCKRTIQRYLDTSDVKSTGGLCKHAKACWGQDAVLAVDKAKDVDKARMAVVKALLENNIIMAAFARKGKGKVTYSHRQHTHTETKDRGFQCLIKIGRPEYYIPSASMVSHDVKLVFAQTRKRIAKMLQKYDGDLNFATNAWTSPNHKAFVAVSVHLEREGEPLAMVLNVVEVAQVHYPLSVVDLH